MRVIVKLESNRHANLDSFPFRYRFYSDKDIDIELTKIHPIDRKYIDKPKERYGVSASFKLPNNPKALRGRFIISKKDNCIITVIREGSAFNTERLLSDTLAQLRKSGDICVEDLFQMYDKKIKTHADVIRFLSDKIGSKKVNEAENLAKRKIENLANALKNKSEESDYLSGVAIAAELEKEEALEEVYALRDKLKISEKKNQRLEQMYESETAEVSSQKGKTMSNKNIASGIDWSEETSTSGVFKSYIVQTPFLIVTLYKDGGERDIKCKNTHGSDYNKAIEDVKTLKDGDMITYSTRGAGAFGSGWFYKIEKDISVKLDAESDKENESLESYKDNDRGLNTDDSDWGYYDHDTDFDIDENGNIRR